MNLDLFHLPVEIVFLHLLELHRPDVLAPENRGFIAVGSAEVAVVEVGVGEVGILEVAAFEGGVGELAEGKVLTREVWSNKGKQTDCDSAAGECPRHEVSILGLLDDPHNFVLNSEIVDLLDKELPDH